MHPIVRMFIYFTGKANKLIKIIFTNIFYTFKLSGLSCFVFLGFGVKFPWTYDQTWALKQTGSVSYRSKPSLHNKSAALRLTAADRCKYNMTTAWDSETLRDNRNQIKSWKLERKIQHLVKHLCLKVSQCCTPWLLFCTSFFLPRLISFILSLCLSHTPTQV